MLFELRRLHVLDVHQVPSLLSEVLVHVEQDLLDDADDLLLHGPLVGDLFKQLVVRRLNQLLRHGLQHLDSRLLDVLVQHLAMLVENEVVASPVQLFVGEGASLLGVDLDDGVFNGGPVLLSLLRV